MGLAFPLEAAISDRVGRTILDNLFASLDPAMRFFAFKLSTIGDTSSFSIGELDSVYADREPEISYSPVYASRGSSYDYWKLPLLSITLNSISIPFALSPSKISGSPSPIAVLDTGTSLILGPTHDVDNFWTAAGGAQRGADGTWLVRCNHLLNVSFLLGNDTRRQGVILDPSDVNWMPETSPSDGWCLGGIQSNDGVSQSQSAPLSSSSALLLCLSFFSRSSEPELLLAGVFRRLAFRRHLSSGEILYSIMNPHSVTHSFIQLIFMMIMVRARTPMWCIKPPLLPRPL